MEKYRIGDIVYYSMEDYETGYSCIYSGKIKSIETHEINTLGKSLDVKFYNLDTGIGLQNNALYTLEELFQMKEKLELLLGTCDKDILTKDTNTQRNLTNDSKIRPTLKDLLILQSKEEK